MKKVSLALMTAFSLFAFAACSSNSSSNNSGTTSASTENVQTTPAGPKTIELSAGDNMKFDKTELHAQPGQQVTVVLHHTGTQSIKSMGHDFVLLTLGSDYKTFGQAATKSGKPGEIPPAFASEVIAHTKLIGGGDSTSVTFKAPTQPGDYPFLCSFPGHYVTMHGKFIVGK